VVVAWAATVTALAAGCAGAPSNTAPAPAVASASVAPDAAASGAPAPASSAAAPSGAPEVNPAGDIPDNQVFVPFTSPDSAVVVSVPEGWARSTDGAATVFTDKFNSVRVEVGPRASAPDPASVRTSDVPLLQASTPGFALHDVQSVRRKAGAAVLVTYDADSPVNPVTGKWVLEAVERYTFWQGGKQAVVTLAGPTNADNVDPWRIVTDSLRWNA
jgi:hypothetical protein